MSVYLIYLLVLLAIFGNTYEESEQKNIFRSSLILNGHDAMDGEFPYQVVLMISDSPDCGGSIIDEYHVLTAAHCFVGTSNSSNSIVAGTINPSNYSDPNRIILAIEESFMHEDYNKTHLQNDLAIIRVSPGFPQDNHLIRPIIMRTEQLKTTAMCTVTGWGATEEQTQGVKYPVLLQALDVLLLDPRNCDYQNFTFTTGMLCAGRKRSGICKGDSGGPLVCEGQLTGIVSGGGSCSHSLLLPGIYTDVAYYRDWIEKTLARSYEKFGPKKVIPVNKFH